MLPELQQLLDAGIACHVDGDLESALVCYGAALELDPGNTIALFNMGVVFEEAGARREAALAFQRWREVKALGRMSPGDSWKGVSN